MLTKPIIKMVPGSLLSVPCDIFDAGAHIVWGAVQSGKLSDLHLVMAYSFPLQAFWIDAH